MVLTSFNNIEETELILVPVKIDAGNYSMKVTCKAKDLYGLMVLIFLSELVFVLCILLMLMSS